MIKPELLEILPEIAETMPRHPDVPLWRERHGLESLGLAMSMPKEPVDISLMRIGAAPGTRTTPAGSEPARSILYFHGGGFFAGSSMSHRHVLARLAIDAEASVYSVDYSLAPEAPFPAAVDDAIAAYRALIREHGLDPCSIVIAGDSAGGCLTLTLLQDAKREGLPQPAGGVLISPWLDMTASGETHDTRADVDLLVSREISLKNAELYHQGKADPKAPRVSPLFGDVDGLAPLLVHAGDCEVLLDDSRRLKEEIDVVGGECALKVYDGLIHMFHFLWPRLPDARAALGEIAEFVRTRTA